jgi:hypothetical protein
MELLETILLQYPDNIFMIADGFDDALIGIEEKTMLLVYSKDKCLEILKEEMDYLEALEYLDYEVNVRYAIPGSPIFINDKF